jgi:hypothetical protein
MSRNIVSGRFVFVSLAACLFTSVMWGGTVPVGYVSWDVNFPGNAGQFDITNLSGPNALPAGGFPITSQVDLTSLSLTVNFQDGSTVIEPSSYFTLSSDGESWDGTAIPIGGTNPLPISATLSGDFVETSITDPGADTIEPGFSVTISPATPPTLQDGDFGVILATECTPGSCSSGSSIPEPTSWPVLAVGSVALLFGMSRRATKNEEISLPK